MKEKIHTKTYFKQMIKDKIFLSTLVGIAIPIIIQNLISSSLNMIDTLMIGRVGQNEIAAVGLANQLFMLIMLGLTGICAGSGIFISQYWGKKDTLNIKKMLGLAIVWGCGYSLVITVLVQIFPTQAIAFFNEEPEILRLGTNYLRIVSISYVFTAITFAYSYALRSIGKTKLPMVASGVAVMVNVIFNALLIFGLLGMPKMGVAGAALATVIARGVEVIIIVGFVYMKKYVLAGNLKELFVIPFDLVKRAFKPTMAIIANEVCWGLATIIYTKAYGHMGSEAIASIQIVNTIINFFTVIIFALGAAALTIVGNAIGEGDFDKAKCYARRILDISLVIGIIVSVAICLGAPIILLAFNVTPEVAETTKLLLYINAVVILPRTYNIIMIMGVFRGGGDTKVALIYEASTMWLVGVPLSFIGVYIFALPLPIVVSLLMVEEVVKAILCMKRFKSNLWAHDLVSTR